MAIIKARSGIGNGLWKTSVKGAGANENRTPEKITLPPKMMRN
jgi:hypothetical protein